MKKVLIIAHLLRASPRIPGIAKYLPEFGWQPIILTAPLEKKPDGNLRIVETGYRETLGYWKKLFKLDPNQDDKMQIKERLGITSQQSFLDFFLTRIGEVVNYPDSDKGWQAFAVKTGSDLINKEGIDAIISSSSPVTGHLIARQLKLKHNIPWVADLRDLWSQNHNYSYSPVRRLVDKRLELKTLAAADALVTVSQPWADKLSKLHGNKITHTITNGFDPETTGSPLAKLTPKFTITYTGLIYPGKQDVTRLFEALGELISERIIEPNDLEVRFYGAHQPWLDREIERYGLSAVARQLGQVPRDVAMQKQSESQVLLLLNWEDKQEIGNYPGKVFEYLAARRPVLATGGAENNVVALLLQETMAGVQAATVENIKELLTTMYREFKSRGQVAYHGDESKINKYSYWQMTRKFSTILDNLSLANKPPTMQL